MTAPNPSKKPDKTPQWPSAAYYRAYRAKNLEKLRAYNRLYQRRRRAAAKAAGA